MTPKSPDKSFPSFQPHLNQNLNPDPSLIRLDRRIDCSRIEKEVEPCFSPNPGRPGRTGHLLFGLHYLKDAFDKSDYSLADRWVENPDRQYCRSNAFKRRASCNTAQNLAPAAESALGHNRSICYRVHEPPAAFDSPLNLSYIVL